MLLSTCKILHKLCIEHKNVLQIQTMSRIIPEGVGILDILARYHNSTRYSTVRSARLAIAEAKRSQTPVIVTETCLELVRASEDTLSR
jgi:hypothetical protein